MDYKKVKTELNKIENQAFELWEEIDTMERNESEQKSKKTGKMIDNYGCMLKALYATKKYGCSGFKGDPECLGCEFRR